MRKLTSQQFTWRGENQHKPKKLYCYFENIFNTLLCIFQLQELSHHQQPQQAYFDLLVLHGDHLHKWISSRQKDHTYFALAVARNASLATMCAYDINMWCFITFLKENVTYCNLFCKVLIHHSSISTNCSR